MSRGKLQQATPGGWPQKRSRKRVRGRSRPAVEAFPEARARAKQASRRSVPGSPCEGEAGQPQKRSRKPVRGRSRPAVEAFPEARARAKQASRRSVPGSPCEGEAGQPQKRSRKPVRGRSRPPARGGPTIDDRSTSGTTASSIVGPPLAGGLPGAARSERFWGQPLRVACLGRPEVNASGASPCGWPAWGGQKLMLLGPALAGGLPGAARRE